MVSHHDTVPLRGKMAKRQRDSVEDVPSTSKKPFVDLTASDEAPIPPPNKESDYKEREKEAMLVLSGFKSDPAFLVENITKGLQALEGALYFLYESKSQHKMLKVQELIHKGLNYLHDKLETVRKITVSVVVFGPLGQGKSFLLNHLLSYGMADVALLPSGKGGSKTPVPVKVRYASSNVKIIIHRKVIELSDEHEKIIFCHEVLNKKSLMLAGKKLNDLFQEKTSLMDVEYVEVTAPLPVFFHLKSVIAKSSEHHDVDVDVEFVDLPGCGDEIGDASIARELDLANVIMFFQAGSSGRPVTSEDLTSVFRRRKVFQYPDRPKFVHVVNERKDCSDLQSDRLEFNDRLRTKTEELHSAWKSLEKQDLEECYQVVHKRLSQLSGVNILLKMQQESEAIILEPEKDDFICHLGEAISMHVKEVQMKKNAHAVVQVMFKVAKQLRKRTTQLITQKRKATQGECKSQNQPKSKPSKPLNNRSFTILKPTEMEENEEDDLVELLKETPKVIDVCNTSAMTEVKDKLIDVFFSQEIVVLHLLDKLKAALEEHWKGLLEEADQTNQLSLCESSQGVILLGEMLCQGRVDRFMEEVARDFIKATVDSLRTKSPTQKLKKRWDTADEEDRKEMIPQLLKQLLANLTEKFQRTARGLRIQTPQKLLNKMLEDINELIKLKPGFSSQVDENMLPLILEKIILVINFSRTMIREVNPHPSLEGVFLDHNVEFPCLKVPPNHESTAFPNVNPTQVFDKVSSILLGKSKGKPIRELEKKLNLSISALDPPAEQDLSRGEWAKTLLNVLCEPGSHLESYQRIPKSLQVDSMNNEHMNQARQQLFAYQRSNASCVLIEDQSVLSGEIQITFNESKSGITALVNADLRTELQRMPASLKDRKTQLAPIFIPTIHPGPDPNMLGNLYLEEDPWSNDETEDNTMSEEEDQIKGYGLGDLDATIFLVVEPRHLERFKSTLDKKPPPRGSKIVVRYVVLPQDGRGIGVARSIIKMLAEHLELPLYWTIDDDIKLLYEFDSNSRRWQKCSFGRTLLFVQRVFQDCTEKAVNDLDETQRQDIIEDVIDKLFPVWAKMTRRKARQLFEEQNCKGVLENQGQLNSPFSVENIQADCDGDPKKEEQLQKIKSDFIKECKSRLQKDAFKRIAGVSVGHEAGKRYDYVSMYAGMHYRKSNQRYQMVLHNTDALKGFNYVQDDVVLKEEEGTIFKKKMLDMPYMGCKREDRSFCHALAYYGIIGYQVIPVVSKHQKLRNAFGHYGRSYENEPVNEEEDKVVSGDGETSDLEENGDNE